LDVSGPRIPLTVWMAIDENGRWGNTTELELNQELQSMISSVKWPVREFGIFPSSKYPDKGEQLRRLTFGVHQLYHKTVMFASDDVG